MGFALGPRSVRKSVIYSEQGVCMLKQMTMHCSVLNSWSQTHIAKHMIQALYIHRANDNKVLKKKTSIKTYWFIKYVQLYMNLFVYIFLNKLTKLYIGKQLHIF